MQYCFNRQALIIAITAHWIDEHWNLREALLDFKRLHGSHTGPRLAKSIFETLEEFKIAEKLFCITTDNASNNKKAMKCLSKLLQKRKKIIWKWKEYHISYLNHIIDLAVQAFLKSIKFIEDNKTEEEEEEEDDEDDDEDDIEEGDGDEEMEEEEVEDEEEGEEQEEGDEGDEGDEEDEEQDEDPSLSQEITGSANEFQILLWKLRAIVKVWSPLSANLFDIKTNSALQENKI